MVVDADVDELPALRAAAATPAAVRVLALALAGDAVSGAGDAAQPLDVDVHELAGVASLVAVRWLWWLEPRALAETDPLEPGRDRRERELERLGDLDGGHPQSP